MDPQNKQQLIRKLTLWLISFMVISTILVTFLNISFLPVLLGGCLALAVILALHYFRTRPPQ